MWLRAGLAGKRGDGSEGRRLPQSHRRCGAALPTARHAVNSGRSSLGIYLQLPRAQLPLRSWGTERAELGCLPWLHPCYRALISDRSALPSATFFRPPGPSQRWDVSGTLARGTFQRAPAPKPARPPQRRSRVPGSSPASARPPRPGLPAPADRLLRGAPQDAVTDGTRGRRQARAAAPPRLLTAARAAQPSLGQARLGRRHPPEHRPRPPPRSARPPQPLSPTSPPPPRRLM